MEASKFQRRVDRLVGRERDHRNDVEVEYLHETEDSLLAEWMRIRRRREEAAHEWSRQEESQARVRRQVDLIEERLLKLHRVDRKDIVGEWEVGFDEIGALEKLSLRHMAQINEVREKRDSRIAQEREASRQHRQQEEYERDEKRVVMAQHAYLTQESRLRHHMEHECLAVWEALGGVFRDTRRKIVDAENHVQNILARHAARLQHIENEKEKLRVEEISKRELSESMERRSYEMMQQMEPESRRRAMQLLASRLKRQQSERESLDASAQSTMQGLQQAEQVAHQQLMAQCEQEYHTVEFRRMRRVLKGTRRGMRMRLEAGEIGNLREEDDFAWGRIRHRFSNSLVYPCVEEESKARQKLAAEKKSIFAS
jgi:hypothetical protein